MLAVQEFYAGETGSPFLFDSLDHF
jgi:hypothetical protein